MLWVLPEWGLWSLWMPSHVCRCRSVLMFSLYVLLDMLSHLLHRLVLQCDPLPNHPECIRRQQSISFPCIRNPSLAWHLKLATVWPPAASLQLLSRESAHPVHAALARVLKMFLGFSFLVCAVRVLFLTGSPHHLECFLLFLVLQLSFIPWNLSVCCVAEMADTVDPRARKPKQSKTCPKSSHAIWRNWLAEIQIVLSHLFYQLKFTPFISFKALICTFY